MIVANQTKRERMKAGRLGDLSVNPEASNAPPATPGPNFKTFLFSVAVSVTAQTLMRWLFRK